MHTGLGLAYKAFLHGECVYVWRGGGMKIHPISTIKYMHTYEYNDNYRMLAFNN